MFNLKIKSKNLEGKADNSAASGLGMKLAQLAYNAKVIVVVCIQLALHAI